MFNSERFSIFLRRSDLSLRAFGKACRPPVDQVQVSRWELGYETPSDARVADLARVLGVEISELTISTRDAVLRAISKLEGLVERGQAPPGYTKKNLAKLRRNAEQMRD